MSGGVYLDKLEAGFETDVCFFEFADDGLEVCAGVVSLADAVLAHAKERLDLCQAGLLLNNIAKVRFRVDVLALKEQENTEVGLGVKVLRVGGEDRGELFDGEFGLLLVEKLVGLLCVELSLLGRGKGAGLGDSNRG